MRIINVLIAVFLISMILSGCSNNTMEEHQDNAQNTDEGDDKMIGSDDDNNNKNNNRIAVIETDKGTIKFELFEQRAPITTANFIKLAQSGFYDGLTFHRVVPGFVAQGGDPDGDGTGGSEESIKLETHPELKNKRGCVAMARSNDPDSASSQFYFCLKDLPHLDGSYAVFGQVIEGLEVVDKLEIGDVMTSVKIENKE